ncbi:MAG: hypothetical protein R2880_06265 [Deinococcales bacterium]
MPHHLVLYVGHVRRELLRALEGIDPKDLNRSFLGSQEGAYFGQ